MLPEFFTSGLAMHPTMFNAHRPLDGAPAQFLKDIARKHKVFLGGSFLVQSGPDIFNTFVLATPDGQTMMHDKDFPSTIYESSFYAAGDDAEYVKKLKIDGATVVGDVITPRNTDNIDGAFATAELRVGAALCWELVRYRTARRLLGKIDLLLGASGWWFSSPKYGWPGDTNDEVAKGHAEQLALIREAPKRLARMLGVPVVHANFVGDNPGFLTSEFAEPVTGQHLGQSQIVDKNGETVALLQDREGVAVCEVEMIRREPLEQIPTEFWMPEMSDRLRSFWATSGAEGRSFYLSKSRPRLGEHADALRPRP